MNIINDTKINQGLTSRQLELLNKPGFSSDISTSKSQPNSLSNTSKAQLDPEISTSSQRLAEKFQQAVD